MASNIRNVLVGGGTGFIGSTVTKMLQHKGYDVTVISRTAGKTKMTWDDVAKFGIPENTFAVVNVAGENVLNPLKRWTDDFKKDVIDSRVKTTSLLAKAIENAAKKPEAFVSMSGVGIYKPSKNIVYDEYTDMGKEYDFISKLAHQWEKAAKTSDDVRRIIVRSGVVLGRTGGMINQIFLQFYFGLGGRMGGGDQPFPWIHLYDLSRLILFAIENKQVTGVINGVAPHIITNEEFVEAFGEALNRPTILPVPGFFFDLIFGKERSTMILDGQKVRPQKVLKEYNFKYLYPSVDAACAEFAKLQYSEPPLKSICS